MKIREKVYTLNTGCRPWFMLSELDFDVQSDDIIELDYAPEGFYSENDSWDPYSRVIIYREREETEEEKEKRLKDIELAHKRNQDNKYQLYLKLKEEFEDKP